MRVSKEHKPQQSRVIQSRMLVDKDKQKSASNVLQKKNSTQPNWYQQYNRYLNIQSIEIGNIQNHVENGGGVNSSPTGLHVLDSEQKPPSYVTIVQKQNIGYNSIGGILWYNNQQPKGNGQRANPIIAKNSSIFPIRFSKQYNGITGVRALMKAVASNNVPAKNDIIKGMGLVGRVISSTNNPPTVYPKANRLQNQGYVQIENVWYYVI